jgi:hypothetical protein
VAPSKKKRSEKEGEKKVKKKGGVGEVPRKVRLRKKTRSEIERDVHKQGSRSRNQDVGFGFS